MILLIMALIFLNCTVAYIKDINGLISLAVSGTMAGTGTETWMNGLYGFM